MPRRGTSIAFWTLPSIVVLLLGLAHVPTPFTGDQALYALAGQAMLDGDVLYRDFVDIKHPGIHHVYAAALAIGVAVGLEAPETRVHVVELAIWLAVGLVGQRTLRRRLRRPELAGIFPIATAGAMYTAVSHWHLSQVESIAGAFVFVGASAATPVRGERWSSRRTALGGALVAIVVAFHGHMVGVALGFLVVAAMFGGVREAAAPLGIGFAAGLALLSLPFVATGAGPGLWEVYVSYPIAADAQVPAESQGWERVRPSLFWFARSFAPWIALAGGALVLASRALRDPLAVQFAAWIVVALATFALETRSSWPFHFLYLVVPVGGLAVFALDAAVSLRPFRRVWWAAFAAAALAVAPGLVAHWRPFAARVVDHLAAHGPGSFDEYRREHSRHYRDAETIAAALEVDAPNGIYVFGNPLVNLAGGHRQALPRNGWGWEVGLDRHWRAFERDVERVRPPVYVSHEVLPMITERAPALRAWLNARAVRPAADGSWYLPN